MGQQKHSTHAKSASADNAVIKHPTEATQASTQKKHWHRVLIEFGLVVGVIVAVWAAGNLLLNRVALGNATFSTRDSTNEIQKTLQTLAANYRLNFLYPDGKTKSFSLDQTGVIVDIPQTTAALRSSHYTPEHLLAWWQIKPAELKTQVDVAKLTNFIDQNIQISERPARNAELHITDGKVQITPGTDGVGYSLAHADQVIENAASNLQKTPLKLQKMAIAPHITGASLQAVNNRVQDILTQHISIVIGSKTITPTASDIGSWLTLTPSETTLAVGINTDNIKQFVADAAKNSSQAARSQVVLDSTGQVLQAGARGVVAGDTNDAAQTLSDALLQAKGTSVTVPVQYTAFGAVQAPTLGKWIEVNVVTKRMYAYDQGQLVRSFLVSAGAAATPTVTGRFAIYSKYRSQNMFGENPNGSSYSQPNVPYVNYFYRDYAIHGNYWRPASYFGAVNSSHGCVGLPVDDSAWVYTWAPVGTPVIVHT